MKALNYPFTHQEVKDLPIGITVTRTYLGDWKDPATGKHHQAFAPTRRTRREYLQKNNPKRNPGYGRFVRRYQWETDKKTGDYKMIVHTIK